MVGGETMGQGRAEQSRTEESRAGRAEQRGEIERAWCATARPEVLKGCKA